MILHNETSFHGINTLPNKNRLKDKRQDTSCAGFGKHKLTKTSKNLRTDSYFRRATASKRIDSFIHYHGRHQGRY